MADLKMVYAALEDLEFFGEKWNNKYPKIYKSWSERWITLSTYFKYSNEVRKLIYTANAIEGFNRQLCKVAKSKTVFPSDDSLLKMLYLATMDITKNGPDAAGTGPRYEPSRKSTLKNGWKKQNSREFYLTRIFTGRMQIRAENQNLVSALSNYQ